MGKAQESNRQYAATAKVLHWLSVLLLLSIMVGAARFAFAAPADRASVIPVHVTFGLIQLGLFAGLFALHRRPTPAEMSRPQSRARTFAQSLNRAFYICFAVQALLGLAMAALSPVAIRFLNSGLNLSQFLPPSPDAIAILRPIHFANALVLATIVVLHIGLAIYRHAALRDGALTPITPFSGLWQRLKAEQAERERRMPSQARRKRKGQSA